MYGTPVYAGIKRNRVHYSAASFVKKSDRFFYVYENTGATITIHESGGTQCVCVQCGSP